MLYLKGMKDEDAAAVLPHHFIPSDNSRELE